MHFVAIGEISCRKTVMKLEAGDSIQCNLKISFEYTSHQFTRGKKYLLGFTLLEKAKWTGFSFMCQKLLCSWNRFSLKPVVALIISALSVFSLLAGNTEIYPSFPDYYNKTFPQLPKLTWISRSPWQLFHLLSLFKILIFKGRLQ